MVNWAFKLSQQVRALAAKPELDLWNPHGGRRAGGSSSIPICFSLITHVQVLLGKLLSLTVKIQRGSLRQGVLGYGLVCTRSLAPGSSGSSAYLFHTFSWPPAMRMAFQGEGVCVSILSLNNCRVFMGHSVIVGFMHRVWENYGTHVFFVLWTFRVLISVHLNCTVRCCCLWCSQAKHTSFYHMSSYFPCGLGWWPSYY